MIDPAVAAHHGRLVKTTGNGLLLEFASVVNAIECAVAVQRGMLSRNAEIAEDRRIVFRIGVNIGDIIIDGGDIYGDGVNVAARLEALCEPGGVYISRSANEQVRDKLSLSFADLGEHTVKNIARAVGVFGLAAKDIATLPEIPIYPTQSERAPVLAGGGVWWLTQVGPAELPQNFEPRLVTALARSLPATSAKYREDTTAGFVKLETFRALAVAPRAGGSWRVGSWSSRELAEEKALEKCQQVFDEPCAVIAVNDTVVPSNADGTWTVRDAPRVRYAGLFNVERIPALSQRDMQRPDVTAYATASGPKAAALHAIGVFQAVTGAASQRAAEEQALRACNNDPLRRSSTGPCYLYAVDNRVVLPLRSTAPLTAAAQIPPTAAASPVVPAGTAIRTALLDAMAKIMPTQTPAAREDQATGHLNASAHKAIAASPTSGSWRSQNWASAAIAEERSLEGCQVRYSAPCVLVAVNDTLQPPPTDGNWPRRPMARVAYDGLFDPRQIPAVNETLRQRPDVAAYADVQGPKAAAFHPLGRMFLVTGAASQHTAEEQALAACNADPQRGGQSGPCLLYAAGNQVVLPRRSTSPATAAN